MKYVAGLIIYPVELPHYPKERRFVTSYTVDGDETPIECYTIKNEHHHWVSDSPLQIGMKCFCGQEEFPGEN